MIPTLKSTVFRKIQDFILPQWVFPLILLFVCFLAYGILIPWLGFYSDDWFLVWSFYKLGVPGVQSFYNFSRPIFGIIPDGVISILRFTPWHYLIFALLIRWLSGILFYLFLKSLFPSQKIFAFAGGALFILYPGFTLQSVSLTFGDIFFVLNIFLLSLYLNVLAIKSTDKRLLFYILALICGSINLLFLDYFFMLELMRPVIIWIVLTHRENEIGLKTRIWLKWYFPFFLAFFGSTIYRAFFLPQQGSLHKIYIFEMLQENFGNSLLALTKDLSNFILMNTTVSWSVIFRIPSIIHIGKTSFIVWIGIIILAFFVSMVIIFFKPSQIKITKNQKRSGFGAGILLCVISFLFAGAPYIVTRLQPSLSDYSSRFNLSFMLGSCMLVGLLLEIIPFKQLWKVVLLSVLIAFSTGWQFINTTTFRLDWKEQKRFYWTLTWRIPDMKIGTLLLSNDILELSKNNASGITSAIDYIYTQKNRTIDLTHLFAFASEHPELLTETNPTIGQWPSYKFSVDKKQITFIYYDGNCPHVLLPDYSFEYKISDPRIEPLITLSSTEGILTANARISPPSDLFGKEPTKDWCYYFSKADLARQDEDWDKVIALEEEALNLFGFPEKNPRQLFLLIEGLALEGNWEKVQELFLEAYQHEFDMVSSQIDEITRLQDTADLKKAYFTFWEYLDVHSHETQAKPEALFAILSVLQSEY